MPRYVSPGRTPSPSRSPSRGRAYTDGVYTPSLSPSPTARSRPRSRRPSTSRSRAPRSSSRGHSRPRPSRSRSYSSDYYHSDDDEYRSRSRGSTARIGRAAKSRLSSALDMSGSTKQEKVENVAKTSLVMLGVIGAASLAAHKFWPKGVTYGDKDDWELEHEKTEEGGEKSKQREKLKGKLREGRDAIEGKGGETGSNAGSSGGSAGRRVDRDLERERILRDRYRERPRLPRSMDGDEGAAFWEKRERMPSRYFAYAPNDDSNYAPDPREPRYLDAPTAVPAPLPPMAHTGTQRRGVEQTQQRYIESAGPPAPPPPVAPTPPRSYADSAPLVVPAGTSRRESATRPPGKGRYYIDGTTIVVPSSDERTYVVQRDAPPGQRLRGSEGGRDQVYYR